jgi:hypothetical protein
VLVLVLVLVLVPSCMGSSSREVRLSHMQQETTHSDSGAHTRYS